MAKVFRQSAFLFLVVGFLVLVKADPIHHDDDHAKLTVKQKDLHDDDDDHHFTKITLKEKTHTDSDSGKTIVPLKEKSESSCGCGDGKMKQFVQKFALILRTYTSKELRPELQKVASKFVEHIVGYLAQEKPQQMSKVNEFLQGTVKVTSNAVAKSGSF